MITSSFLFFFQAEGIFRLTAENSEEEAVREQLNRGFIPERIDVHCLAGLIKVCNLRTRTFSFAKFYILILVFFLMFGFRHGLENSLQVFLIRCRLNR